MTGTVSHRSRLSFHRLGQLFERYSMRLHALIMLHYVEKTLAIIDRGVNGKELSLSVRNLRGIYSRFSTALAAEKYNRPPGRGHSLYKEISHPPIIPTWIGRSSDTEKQANALRVRKESVNSPVVVDLYIFFDLLGPL
jgi:hypothetical protein